LLFAQSYGTLNCNITPALQKTNYIIVKNPEDTYEHS
jgi:hypothetical protein